ncbi:hypothetical protein K2173_024223 [Erythroxylum novogranatense]|uniref:PRC-barrel domain-containing protein n=1 Tax=Erythroxylum novogranatense TaxID=1862640 RepID=A0AAV8UFN1_9ROSI|nr:hypothetical protein K2173_024223 [Erythroxylum novogranatense]
MCDCVPLIPFAFSITQVPNLGFEAPNLRRCCSWIQVPFTRSGRFKLVGRAGKNPRVIGSEEYDFRSEFGIYEEKGGGMMDLESRIERDSKTPSGSGANLGRLNVEMKGSEERAEELSKVNDTAGVRRGRQLIKRSNLLAKQVISIQSAHVLGFISQLWVDTASWVVLLIEVRPSLLSGELERFRLEDVSQVGDVILVEDENVMENEIKMVGLETLVGYKVVTPGRRSIGKVRGYSFNVNSGLVKSLELDAFGFSIIPSNLISTYALLVEDVLEVLSDTVVVHEAAVSRIQRLTKGIWDSQNVSTSADELEEFSDNESSVRSSIGGSTQKRFGRPRNRPKIKESGDDWELPMDYL